MPSKQQTNGDVDHQDAERAVWGIRGLDPRMKLYLLALTQDPDPDLAEDLAGLPAGQGLAWHSWFARHGLLLANGRVDAEGVMRWAKRVTVSA